MFINNLTNLIALKLNNFLVKTITSTLLLVIFLTIYVAVVGAILGYFYFRKHRDSLNGYLSATKYCPLATKVIIKFWIELQSSFRYDLMLSGWIKVKEAKTKDNDKELKEILADEIVLDKEPILFESTTLFLLTNTKDFFRFK